MPDVKVLVVSYNNFNGFREAVDPKPTAVGIFSEQLKAKSVNVRGADLTPVYEFVLPGVHNTLIASSYKKANTMLLWLDLDRGPEDQLRKFKQLLEEQERLYPHEPVKVFVLPYSERPAEVTDAAIQEIARTLKLDCQVLGSVLASETAAIQARAKAVLEKCYISETAHTAGGGAATSSRYAVDGNPDASPFR